MSVPPVPNRGRKCRACGTHCTAVYQGRETVQPLTPRGGYTRCVTVKRCPRSAVYHAHPPPRLLSTVPNRLLARSISLHGSSNAAVLLLCVRAIRGRRFKPVTSLPCCRSCALCMPCTLRQVLRFHDRKRCSGMSTFGASPHCCRRHCARMRSPGCALKRQGRTARSWDGLAKPSPEQPAYRSRQKQATSLYAWCGHGMGGMY